MTSTEQRPAKAAWNKGKLVGQKAPLKLKDVWAIRIRLQLQNRTRERALLELGIDSKLRACDLVGLRVRDICQVDRVSARPIVMQRKTQRSVQFGLGRVRNALAAAHEALADPPTDRELASRPTAARTLETREHGEVPGDRCRRCLGNN